jgi:hypothetical protein
VNKQAGFLLRWIALLTLGLCGAMPGFAQAPDAEASPKVMVRAVLDNTKPVVAGQQVHLTVDAMTTTWFTQAPIYPDIKTPNADIVLLDQHAQNFNETIGQEKWFGVSRTYVITPTGGGDVTIPAFEVVMHAGQSETPLTAKSTALTLALKPMERPAGAGNLLVSNEVKIIQTLDKKIEELKVGDALTRTIEIQTAGTQGMLIPPTTFTNIDGLAIYPKAATVDNTIKNRNGFVSGSRIDAATYVIQKKGKYTLPEVVVNWWNPATGKAEKARAPAVEFTAKPNPDYKTEFSLPKDAKSTINQFINWHLIGLLIGVALLLGFVIYLLMQYVPRGLVHWNEWKAEQQERYAASELAAFKQLEHAISTGDAAHIYAALLNWAEHPQNPQHLDGLCKSSPELAAQLNALRTVLFGSASSGNNVHAHNQTKHNQQPWNGSALLQATTQLRQAQHAQLQPAGTRLEPLNPV